MKDKIIEKIPVHLRGLVAMVFAALFWSTGGLFIKIVELDALQINFYRSAFASLTFYLLFNDKVWPINIFGIINSIFYAGILILFVIATKLTTAANAIFLQYTAPIYVLILEPILLKTEFKKINLITVLVCLGGMVLFFIGKLSIGNIEGNIIALLSGIFFAALILGLALNDKKYQIPSIFYGNVLITLFCFVFIYPEIGTRLTDIFYVSLLGIFQIGIAYALFLYAIKRIEGIEAALVGMLEPILNPVWVYLGYGEVPTIYAIIGGIVILTAIGTRTFLVEKKFKNL